MNKKKAKELSTENVRISKAVVNLVRKEKERTGVGIGRYIEITLREKLEASHGAKNNVKIDSAKK